MDSNTLKSSDFDDDLPQELIAQTPIEPRDSSRLLVVDCATGQLQHRRHFYDIADYLHSGDLLIANQSRVIPARLAGRRAESEGAVEVLLLCERPDLGANCWETLVRPGRRLREGARILFADTTGVDRLAADVVQRTDVGGRIVRLSLINASNSVGARFIVPPLNP
ncbi:MAG: S-adenosylmethionine:tRNA ribosyltransferase-isomerase, partial [Ktedonobacteraceae bacterium]|nr:S-adenosylmethionine:tRNA ribosyltransferase-isomerase [Ktedonobacteraceae bacterium]